MTCYLVTYYMKKTVIPSSSLTLSMLVQITKLMILQTTSVNLQVSFIFALHIIPKSQSLNSAISKLLYYQGVDNFDPSRYPNQELREKWVTAYLRSFHQSQYVNDSKVQLLVEHIELFTLASHFFWGVWALIQAAHSSIDFDFLG